MTRRSLSRVLAIALVVVVTFPWDLQDHAHWYKVAWVPFATGIVLPRDLVINFFLYMPLGFAMPARSARSRLLLAAGAAVGLSCALEIAQVWSHVRFPSATDVTMNVLGSVAGAALAERRARRSEPGSDGGSAAPGTLST